MTVVPRALFLGRIEFGGRRIEEDLVHYATQNLDLLTDRLTWQCEQVIRNYDPCISCASHCLRLQIER